MIIRRRRRLTAIHDFKSSTDSSLVIGEMSASDAGAYTLSIANNIGSTLLTPGAAVQLSLALPSQFVAMRVYIPV